MSRREELLITIDETLWSWHPMGGHGVGTLQCPFGTPSLHSGGLLPVEQAATLRHSTGAVLIPVLWGVISISPTLP